VSILRRAGTRFFLRHPGQLALALLGVALGIAVLVAVDLSVASAQRAFVLANARVMGSTTDQIIAGPGGLSETFYVRLRRALPELLAAPVIEGRVAIAGQAGRQLRLLGIDPFAEGPFRGYVTRASRGRVLASLLTRPGAVLMGRESARTHGFSAGASIALQAAGGVREARLVGILAPRDALGRTGLADLLVADIATAQELLDRIGSIDRIGLILPAGAAGAALRARLAGLLPPGARLRAALARERGARQMTRAFDLNLRMLSLLALVVGVFLIYNTMSFAVVRRRDLIGRLRALGVTRERIFVQVLGEAAVLGVLGGALGALLGVALARELVGLVTHTVNDLYFAVTVGGVAVDPAVLFKALAVGGVAALLAALAPALEALRVTPGAALLRSGLERRARRAARLGVVLGSSGLIAGAALLALPHGGLGAGFAALLGIVGGAALLAPAATRVLLGVCESLAAAVAGRFARHAVRAAAASLSRTAVAVAALMVALAATIGIGVMVDSFRHTVADWLGTTLRADLYVGTPGSNRVAALDADLGARIRRIPGVAALSLGRRARVLSPAGEVAVLALRMAPRSYAGFHLIEGDPKTAWRAFDRGAVLVSEPFAYRHRIAPGARLELLGDTGPVRLAVAGVYRDYASERGQVLMSRATWERHWRARGYTAFGVYLAPGADARTVTRAIEALRPPARALRVRASGAIRAASLVVFDRTFAITEVLRMLATLIAFVGVLGALMALELERARELAVLRALGLTRRGLWLLVQAETAVLGLIAGLLSVPLGLVIAWLLIHVINRRSFGWTMTPHVDPVLLLQAVVLALLAAWLAGLYPSYRMARTPPALALREE